uniref:Uncharacterized protein n=1 Tax=Oryza nivara TaxID=4536 RepID=A0A0E0I6Z3_ORYNI
MRTACAASTICHPPSLSFSNPSTASSLSRRRGAAEEDETMGGAGAAEDGRFARPAPSSPRSACYCFSDFFAYACVLDFVYGLRTRVACLWKCL